MEEERNITPIIAVIILVIIFVAVGVWFFLGRNRIVRAVPEEGSSSRVILVTPRQEPTIEVEPTDEATPSASDDDSETETPTPTTKDEPTKAPTKAPSKTPTATSAAEIKTTPTPSGE